MKKNYEVSQIKKFEAHGFCGIAAMFLTPPTVDELKQSDLQELIDMLARQSIEYTRLLKQEGASFKTIAIREMILNIQAAIEAKKKLATAINVK